MAREGDYVRNIKAHIAYVLNGKDIDISKSVVRAKVEEIACSGNVLKMGEFCKNSIEFEYKPSLLETPEIFWNNKIIKASLKYEYLFPKEDTFPSPVTFLINALMLGIFYVSSKDVETSNNGYTYTVTAYDVPPKMSELYDVENSPNNSIEILNKIENDTGMKFYNKELISSFSIDSIPDGTTYAGMVGYIAGYEGYNARVNSTGDIEFYWYYNASIDQTSIFTITRKDQYLGGFKNNDELPSINAISSGKDVTDSNENGIVFTAGSGESMTYQNPYITQEKVNEIYNRIKGFEYCIGEIKWRGDQAVRAGDLVRIETKTGEYVLFPVMEYSMTFDGGMVAESSSYSYIVDNNVMGTAPTEKKIVKLYNNLTETFKKQTGIVKLNAKGGFYRLLIDDETGFPYGWIVSDSEEITETTKGWMWTKGGLMHSSDGFRTADKVAFTEDGQLSAEMISAHSISLGNLNVDALNEIQGAYDHADSGDENTLSSAKSYADTSAQNAVNAQTQDDIFNKLTNNGTVKGIVLQNGKLYINADYITSGILNATLLRAGIIKSTKNDGNYWNLDTGEFAITGYATDSELSSGVSDAKSYASTQATNALSSAKSYSDTGDSNTLTSANQTAQEKANAAESNAKTYSDNKISALNNLLTQTEIFNRLTNNGQTQGIYLQNGKIYINMEYLVSNIIKGLSIFGSTITFGDDGATYRVQASYRESDTSYDGYKPKGVLFQTYHADASIQHVTDRFFVTYFSDKVHNPLQITRSQSILRSEKSDGSVDAFFVATAKDDGPVANVTAIAPDVMNTVSVTKSGIKLAVAWTGKYLFLDNATGDFSFHSMASNKNDYIFSSSDGNVTYKTYLNNFLQACDGKGNVKSSLNLQSDGKVFINGSSNGNTFINGYPAVRVNGSYHDIYFQWNGASLIATVDATQVWSTSDRRLKDQIETINDDYIDAIGSAEIKQFIFTDEIYDKSIKHFGVIAQDVREALESKGINPEEIAVNNHFDRDGEEYYGIDKEEFLMARIAYDEKKIKELEDKISRLEAIVSKLSL